MGGGGPGGFPGATGPQAGYPSAATTPTYGPPAFPQSQAPGSGYNYPTQGQNDFPAGPTGTTGYPSQRPTGTGFSNAPTGSGAGQPYPGAQAPSAPGASYPGAQVPSTQGGAQYPAGGQAQRPTGPGPQRGPPAVAAQPSGFGGQQPGQTGGGFVAGPQGGSSSGSSSSSQQDESQEGDYSAIPGEPDVDYPIYSEIPETSFDCNQQEFPGYYADVEARCQVFHICALNKTFDFLCPNGTIFSQENLVCVWWNQFDCNSAPGLFGNNANLYDNTQTGAGQGQGQGQGAAIGQGPQAGPTGVANDFVGGPGAGPTGPYPSAGRPQTQAPGFASSAGGYQPSGPAAGSGYQPSGPAAGGNYPAASPTGSNYPGTTAGFAPSGPSQGYPSTQGPYPSAGAGVPPSNVPSFQQPQGFPSQADAPYPPSGTPQTPTRDYLPPRRG